jgi:hypothetical protein
MTDFHSKGLFSFDSAFWQTAFARTIQEHRIGRGKAAAHATPPFSHELRIVPGAKRFAPSSPCRAGRPGPSSLGIPAHTLCVAFQYPDYHKVGDHGTTLDYANMARVDRTVALGLIRIGNDRQPPRWNEANAAAARYIEPARKRGPIEGGR